MSAGMELSCYSSPLSIYSLLTRNRVNFCADELNPLRPHTSPLSSHRPAPPPCPQPHDPPPPYLPCPQTHDPQPHLPRPHPSDPPSPSAMLLRDPPLTPSYHRPSGPHPLPITMPSSQDSDRCQSDLLIINMSH